MSSSDDSTNSNKELPALQVELSQSAISTSSNLDTSAAAAVEALAATAATPTPAPSTASLDDSGVAPTIGVPKSNAIPRVPQRLLSQNEDNVVIVIENTEEMQIHKVSRRLIH